MAALIVIVAYTPNGFSQSGNPRVHAGGFIGDPALQGQGAGQDMQGFSTVAELPANTPGTWLADIRAACIAEAANTASFPAPFTVASNRVFIPSIV